MSNFTFRPAKRENVALLIGLIGASGGGKTYTAMRLATGMSGGKPFAVIDTEAGRAQHYADQFKFDHGDMKSPFSPSAYADAIKAADEAGYPVIVVDSASHEHAGDGGILDMQEAEFQRMGARESAKMASWIKPKMEHKKMVQKLLQIRAHLILCFRAEEKIEMVKNDQGKIEVRKKVTATGIDGWAPICEKTLPYELTASLLLLAAHPGIPHPIKLQEQHRKFFPLDRPITEDSGIAIAAWSTGGQAKTAATQGAILPAHQSESASSDHSGSATSAPAAATSAAVTPSDDDLVTDIGRWCKKGKFDMARDLARGIQDATLKTNTMARIDYAENYVKSKGANQ